MKIIDFEGNQIYFVKYDMKARYLFYTGKSCDMFWYLIIIIKNSKIYQNGGLILLIFFFPEHLKKLVFKNDFYYCFIDI